MSTLSNPFLRGYTQLTITRMLLIDSRDGAGMCYRPAHFLHTDLPDSQLEGTFCRFGEDFALIPERQTLPDDLLRQCPHSSFVFAVVRSITALHGDSSIHIGDAHSAQAAQEVVRQLSFHTGHYSRCWEVSTKHLTPTSLRWLGCCAEGPPPPGVLFQAFHIPGSQGAIGVRLQATPWTDAHLSDALGVDVDAAYLRQSHELARMPLNLIDVLSLAALADTRIVIFDPDAPVLAGLPLHA